MKHDLHELFYQFSTVCLFPLDFKNPTNEASKDPKFGQKSNFLLYKVHFT